MASEKVLVTFSTPTYWVRQQFLNLSAIFNGIVDRTEKWDLGRLSKTGFQHANSEISLRERGAGFWSWKPYIIEHALMNARIGDVICYSDVGRMRVLLLRTSLEPFINWMDANGQDCIPGVHAPWHGPISKWARKDTLEAFGCAEPRFYQAPQMQASFSIWRKTPETMAFVTEWKECCFNRKLVSDDPNPSGQENFPEFITQYGDQTILSLLSLKKGLKGLEWPTSEIPPFMEKSPEDWLIHLGETVNNGPINRLLATSARAYLSLEVLFRQRRVS
jgi:hypothetical protein